MAKRVPGHGGPAKGVGGGPGKGDGWGGPAKGLRRFEVGNNLGSLPRRSDDPTWKELIRMNLAHLALHAEREETQITASIAYLNRVEGMPVARNMVDVKGEVTLRDLVRRSYEAPALPDIDAEADKEKGDE